MSQASAHHKADAPPVVRCAVLTVSDTRTLETDTGGRTVVEHLQLAGHLVAQRELVPDDPDQIAPLLDRWILDPDIDAILVTGGTGITRRDRTYDTVAARLTTPLPGYGELFRMLSYHEIGPAAMLSRATGGLADRTVLLTMPGSRAAVELAMRSMIVPELNHLVREARR